MGLDLIPQSKPLPGHEKEWQELLQRSFSGGRISEEEIRRYHEISTPPYASIGAPRVGFDEAADRWIVEKTGAKTPAEIAECLAQNHGYYVVALLGPPACPPYSHAAFGHVDETSFRGSFFHGCADIMGEDLFEKAWQSMWPDEAVAFGRALLEAAEKSTVPPRRKPSWFAKLILGRYAEPEPMFELEESAKILRAAGEWYIFWGERGHPIKAWG